MRIKCDKCGKEHACGHEQTCRICGTHVCTSCSSRIKFEDYKSKKRVCNDCAHTYRNGDESAECRRWRKLVEMMLPSVCNPIVESIAQKAVSRRQAPTTSSLKTGGEPKFSMLIPVMDTEKLRQDLGMLDEPTIDGVLNFCHNDPYYAQSLERRYGKPLSELREIAR